MTHSLSETGFRLAHVELADFEPASEIRGRLQKLEGLEVGSSVVELESDPLELGGDILFGDWRFRNPHRRYRGRAADRVTGT